MRSQGNPGRLLVAAQRGVQEVGGMAGTPVDVSQTAFYSHAGATVGSTPTAAHLLVMVIMACRRWMHGEGSLVLLSACPGGPGGSHWWWAPSTG